MILKHENIRKISTDQEHDYTSKLLILPNSNRLILLKIYIEQEIQQSFLLLKKQ